MIEQLASFEDILEYIATDAGRQGSMDRLYDNMAKNLSEWRNSMRARDSHWMTKADDMAEAAFIYGFLCARRMTRVCLTQATGTETEEEA